VPPAREPQLLSALPAPVQSAAEALRDEVSTAFGTTLHALYRYGAVTFPESIEDLAGTALR
jgi:hypothetical protein